MATQAREGSNFDGTHSSLQNSQASIGFGVSAGSSSMSCENAGYVNRTVSVSELLAFRNRDGKDSDKQMPFVSRDSMWVTTSFSTLNFCSDAATSSCSTIPAFSSTPPTVTSSELALLVGGRRSSAAAQKDSKCAACCIPAYTTGLIPSSVIGSSDPFVFSAGASDTRPLNSGTHARVCPGDFFSGRRPASQSNNRTDGLLSGKSWPEVNVSTDKSPLEPLRATCPPTAPNNASFIGSSVPISHVNALRGSLFSGPSGPAAPASSLTAPFFVGVSKYCDQAEDSSEMQYTGLIRPVEQTGIPLEELLGASNAFAEVRDLSIFTVERETFAVADHCISKDITWKLNRLDIDGGINPSLNLNKQGVGKDAVKASACAPKTEIEHALETLDIGKEGRSPLKMENLVASAEGSARGGISVECTESRRSKAPPSMNVTSFKFSAEAEVKSGVTKVTMCRSQRRHFRSIRRSGGKKSASTTSSGRSGAATPSPSSDGALKDTHFGRPEFSKSRISENDEGDKLIGGDFGAESRNSMTELEASIQEISAAVSQLNVGARFRQENGTSCAVPLFNARGQDTCLDGNRFTGVSHSAGPGRDWEGKPTANPQAVDRAEPENYLVEHGDLMSEVNDREDEKIVVSKSSVAGINADNTEISIGSQNGNVVFDGQSGAESKGMGCAFTFSASSTGISTSEVNLRRRTRKAHKSGGRVSKGGAAPVPDRCNSGSLSTMKSDILFGSASLGGLVGSGYGDGVNTPGVGVFCGCSSAAAEQICERWRLRGNQAYAKGDFAKAEEFYSLGAESVSPHETSQSCIRASMLCYSNRAATRMVVGRLREALADCVYAMRVDPSFVRVHLRAAGCHLALGETDMAATAFKECLKQAQGASKVDSKVLADASVGLKKSYQVAECLKQVRNLLHSNSSGEFVAALRLLNDALLASPQSEWLLELKAYMLISLQRFTEAVQVCKQSFPSAEKNFPALDGNRYENFPLGWRWRMTVKAYFHLGKLEEALELLQQLQENPSMFSSNSVLPGAFSTEMNLPSTVLIRDLLHHKLEGNKAFQAGKFNEALDHYNAALARNDESRPFCAVCLCNRAAASQALGQIADAIADCSRAIALDPRYAKAISRRASLHEKVRDYGHCICDLERLIAMYERQSPQMQGVRSPKVDSSAGSTTRRKEALQQARGRLRKAEEEMKKGIPLNHYSILGLELGCPTSEIRKSYRRAALRHHPDKAGQFLMRSGDTGDGTLQDTVGATIQTDGERLIDEVRKDSEQLFKLIGEAYAVLSDPAKRSRYDSEEDMRKLRTSSSDPSKSVYSYQNYPRTSDGANVQGNGGWSSSCAASETGSRSRASRQRDRWEGFNYQYHRWHPEPDAAQPDVYARRGWSAGSTSGSSHRSTSCRWEGYAWDDVY